MRYLSSSNEYKTKTKVFETLIKHKNECIYLKQLVNRITKNHELRKQFYAFNVWKKIQRRSYEHDCKIHKENMFSSVKSAGQVKNTYADKLNQIKMGTQKLELKLQKQGRHILGSNTYRLMDLSLKSIFETWRQNIKIKADKQRLLTAITTKITTRNQQEIMTFWINWVQYSDLNKGYTKLDKRLKEKSQLIHTKDAKQKQLSIKNKSNYDQKQSVYFENSQYLSKTQKTLSLIKSNNDKNHYYSKLRVIFTEWRIVANQKREGLMKLSKVIQQKMIQSTFSMIQSVSYTKQYVSKRQRILSKAVKN